MCSGLKTTQAATEVLIYQRSGTLVSIPVPKVTKGHSGENIPEKYLLKIIITLLTKNAIVVLIRFVQTLFHVYISVPFLLILLFSMKNLLV